MFKVGPRWPKGESSGTYVNTKQIICRCTSFKTKKQFSTSAEKFKTLLESHSQRKNISEKDWYGEQTSHLDETTLKILNEEFKGSLYIALSTLYPETEWHAWKFVHQPVPQGHWKEQSNQRKFFDDLGKKMNINTMEDWYEKLTFSTIAQHGGTGLTKHFGRSPTAALMAAYPEHNWILWKFKCTPMGFWKSRENQKKYFQWLGDLIGIKQLDDWYEKLSKKLLMDNDGHGLLDHYNNSAITALMAVYPNHNWTIWKFNMVPNRFWKDIKNQKLFFDDMGKKLGIQQLDDWYGKLSMYAITEHGGRSMLPMYNGSPAAALMASYPEHNWIPWKFENLSHAVWSSKENVSKFLAELSEKLSIQTLEDWYRVDLQQLHQFGAAGLLSKYRGLPGLLKEQYPRHLWDMKRFQQKGKKGQRWLAVTLKKMFPNEEDYNHSKLLLPSSNRPLQLDVFIPSKNLAFEYQGIQHYEDIGVFSPTKTYQQRDEEKRTLCASNNIKLIEVPYWWNRTQESIQEMINQQNFGTQ